MQMKGRSIKSLYRILDGESFYHPSPVPSGDWVQNPSDSMDCGVNRPVEQLGQDAVAFSVRLSQHTDRTYRVAQRG
jgi:hypothetical protein